MLKCLIPSQHPCPNRGYFSIMLWLATRNGRGIHGSLDKQQRAKVEREQCARHCLYWQSGLGRGWGDWWAWLFRSVRRRDVKRLVQQSGRANHRL
jgi:hypothetical protein